MNGEEDVAQARLYVAHGGLERLDLREVEPQQNSTSAVLASYPLKWHVLLSHFLSSAMGHRGRRASRKARQRSGSVPRYGTCERRPRQTRLCPVSSGGTERTIPIG